MVIEVRFGALFRKADWLMMVNVLWTVEMMGGVSFYTPTFNYTLTAF